MLLTDMLKESKILLLLFLVFVVSIITYASFFIIPISYEDFSQISAVFYIVIPAITTVLVFRTYKMVPKELQVYKKMWLLIFLGVLLWFLAEFSWGIYDTILGEGVPGVTIADGLWIIGYPLFYGAMFMQYTHMKKELGIIPSKIQMLNLLIAGVGILAVLIYLIFIPVLEYASQAEFIETITNFAYPILDTILIFMAMGLVFMFGKSRMGLTWILLVIAFISAGIADLAWFYLIWYDVYFAAGWEIISAFVDLGWLFEYTLIGFAAFIYMRTIKGEF
ncbi:MAG: hypothetical protein JXA43_03700 [Candidatus Diapherotrites archaeon]|nr:hypothetical protein [Candidatus Diapherotrites archaeon]